MALSAASGCYTIILILPCIQERNQHRLGSIRNTFQMMDTCLGYSNIPFAIGWGVGNAVSGPLYENMGSKINFAREYLINEFGMPAAQVADIPTEKVMETMAQYLNNGQGGTVDEATRILWSLNDPWMVWVILTAIGSVSTLSMIAYYIKTRKSGISSNS